MFLKKFDCFLKKCLPVSGTGPGPNEISKLYQSHKTTVARSTVISSGLPPKKEMATSEVGFLTLKIQGKKKTQ